MQGGPFNTVATYTSAPTTGSIFGMPWAPDGLMSRSVLPSIEPGPAEVEVLVRWTLDNLNVPRSRFSLCGTGARTCSGEFKNLPDLVAGVPDVRLVSHSPAGRANRRDW